MAYLPHALFVSLGLCVPEIISLCKYRGTRLKTPQTAKFIENETIHFAQQTIPHNCSLSISLSNPYYLPPRTQRNPT